MEGKISLTSSYRVIKKGNKSMKVKVWDLVIFRYRFTARIDPGKGGPWTRLKKMMAGHIFDLLVSAVFRVLVKYLTI